MDEPPKQSPGQQHKQSAEPTTKAPATTSDGNKKGTGVFFGPILANRLAGNSSAKKQQPKEASAGSSSGRVSAPGPAGSDAGPDNSRNGAGRRRASASIDLPRSPTPVAASARSQRVGRSTSFTASSSSSSSQGLVFRSSGSSMPGGSEFNLYNMISSPHGLSTPARDASISGPCGTPASMLPAQQMHVLQQQLQQQQQALDQEVIQQEQQRIQEVQQLQAQLQQLLQQQQKRAQQPTAPQQQLQHVNMPGSSNNGASLLLSSGALAPEFQGQMQVLLQPVAGTMGGTLQQQPSAQGPFVALSCAADLSQQTCMPSVSAFRPPDTDLNTMCALPNLHSADYPTQQQLQAQMQMPILHGASGPSEDDDDDKQVAALDVIINQCMSRLLQLRGQILARRAAAAPVGLTCLTPTATPATGNTASYGVSSSAAGLTADSLLMQPISASQPLLLIQQMQQQQHSGMLSPASSMGGQLLPPQQQPVQQIVSNGRVMWVQQQQQPVGAGTGGDVMVSAPGFGVPLQMGSACLPLPQSSSCNAAGAYVAQPMPSFVQQQSRMAVLGQQQQQVMLQPVAGQLTASFSGNDGRGSYSGYFSPPAGTSGQQVLVSPGIILQEQMQQQVGAAGPQLQQQAQVDMQQLQQLLAQQQMQGLVLK